MRNAPTNKAMRAKARMKSFNLLMNELMVVAPSWATVADVTAS